jgi:hypothetical protein
LNLQKHRLHAILRVNKDGVSASSEKQRLISMAQTAYEEAGMWAVKAITEGI